MPGSGPAKVELHCPGCARDSWLVRKPQYDGFVKTGELLACALCGHHFASAADIPVKESSAPRVFSEADRPRPVKIFRDDEKGRMCRYCAEYVVNPFLQRCGLHRCEVQATDTCPHFRSKPPPQSAVGPEGQNSLP